MRTRSITYGSISGGENSNGTIQSNAETWGDLKAQEANIAALSVGRKAVVKFPGNDFTISSDSDQLPDGDFKLYFVVDKNDSGRA